MSNPFVYYRIESPESLIRYPSRSVCSLGWHTDLPLIRRFYARFSNQPFNPDELGPYVGNPLAILLGGEIASFAIPLSFREGETALTADEGLKARNT